jgi:hypothetical protein
MVVLSSAKLLLWVSHTNFSAGRKKNRIKPISCHAINTASIYLAYTFPKLFLLFSTPSYVRTYIQYLKNSAENADPEDRKIIYF